MKTKKITSALFAIFFASALFAQDRTTVNATNSEISDNLDLRAVASIFGDAENLEDFERRLNDPKIQISNLDLNDDNQVDYLRVIESVEGNTHLVIVQAVLGRDVFQDVATIEVERDQHNNVQVQVVGDVYMYGQNYIYEPVYVHTPWFYTSFWVGGYHPYVSSWYWDYYPTYYYGWTPFPVFRYRNNCSMYINTYNTYNYVTVRRSRDAVRMYDGRRTNYYERQNPTRSFAQRNTTVRNRYELNETRNTRNGVSRNDLSYNTPRNGNVRTNNSATPRTGVRNDAGTTTRNNGTPRTNNNILREGQNNTTRTNNTIRTNSSESNTPRSNSTIRTNSEQRVNSNTSIRTNSDSGNQRTRTETTVRTNQNESIQSSPRQNDNVRTSNENTNPRNESQPRQQSVRADNEMRSAPQSQQRSVAPTQNQSSSRGNGGQQGYGGERGNGGGRR